MTFKSPAVWAEAKVAVTVLCEACGVADEPCTYVMVLAEETLGARPKASAAKTMVAKRER
jgi:hypothetical protein